jgi:Domain of unknown function (DUF4260)
VTTGGRVLPSSPIHLPGAAGAASEASAGRRWRRRYLWVIPGLAIAIFANAQASAHGLGLAPVLLFGIIPHLPALLGIGQPHAKGQMARRAVPSFNLMHHPAVPVAILAAAAAGILTSFWLVAALAWISHIVVDLAFGHGLRTADGWRRGWWTWR